MPGATALSEVGIRDGVIAAAGDDAKEVIDLSLIHI